MLRDEESFKGKKKRLKNLKPFKHEKPTSVKEIKQSLNSKIRRTKMESNPYIQGYKTKATNSFTVSKKKKKKRENM